MFVRALGILTTLLFCSQLFAATEVVEHLKGTSYASKLAINSRLEVRMLRWSDEQEQEAVLSAYDEYLQNHDGQAFAGMLEEQKAKGYLLTSEVSGYVIRYAWREQGDDGERMVLLLTPDLTSKNPNIWREPKQDGPGFTLVELHLSGEQGVVKTSLDTGIMLTGDGRLALQDFDDAQAFGVVDKLMPPMGT